MNEETIFTAALAIANGIERDAYVERACRGNPDLRRQIEKLLAAHEGTNVLDRTPVKFDRGDPLVVSKTDSDTSVVVGDRVGPYTLLEKIGEGGMGEVWLADQKEPLKRQVALKLIKPGMDSRGVLSRFEAERQALAVMDHPNVAKVLDAGTTPGGRPYFVMELVTGTPITEFADAQRLTLPQRLRLFVPVCRAIQHAHMKGIIHRDIKPSNVLVAQYDQTPTPKVIDFGVAKAIGPRLTEKTIDTGFGALVGTPAYMAPEQATFDPSDIDTRVDVYALGVLLYELLAGGPPIEQDRLRRAAIDEVLRIVREDEPPRPSQRLSTADTRENIAAVRGAEPATLSALVKGELDWIVMKSIEKDRTRRYDSANDFASDVVRYLNGDAVLAHPPSAGYRFGKFVRRHRGQAIAAGLVFGSLLAGVIGTTWGLIRSDAAREVAETKEQDANRERGRAVVAARNEREARLAEERERTFAETIAAFVKDDFLALTSVEGQDRFGGEGLDRNSTLVDLLNRAAAKLQGQKQLEPRIEAELCWIVGVNYRGAGLAAKGIPFLERCVELRQQFRGKDHPETRNAGNSLGRAYMEAGKLEMALTLYEGAFRHTHATLGPDHADTLVNMNNLADCSRSSGKIDKAMPLLRESVALHKTKYGIDHIETLRGMNNLAVGYWADNQFEPALRQFEEVFNLRKAKFGPDHADTLTSMNNLAVGYKNTGKNDEALKLIEEAYERRKAKLGPDHPDTLISLNNLAGCRLTAGQTDAAVALFQEAFALRKAKLGPDHPDTLGSMTNLAVGYRAAGQPEKVPPVFEDALTIVKAKHGPDHATTLAAMANLAASYDAIRQYDKGERILRERLIAEKRVSSAESSAYAGALAQLGLNLMNQKKWSDAEPPLRESVAIREKKEPDAWSTFNMQSMLGGVLSGQKKYAEAEPLLAKGFEGMKAREKAIPAPAKARVPESLDRLIELYTATKKADELKKYRALRAAYPDGPRK